MVSQKKALGYKVLCTICVLVAIHDFAWNVKNFIDWVCALVVGVVVFCGAGYGCDLFSFAVDLWVNRIAARPLPRAPLTTSEL